MDHQRKNRTDGGRTNRGKARKGKGEHAERRERGTASMKQDP